MNRTAVFGLAVVLLAGGVLLVASPLARSFRKPAVEAKKVEIVVDESYQEEPGILTEYTLTERSGRKFHSKELDGKVHLANFFFSMCPRECPRQTAEVARIDNEFGPRGVRFVSITCDPERDTPLKLQEYANGFNADRERWSFLTGEFEYIRRVAAEIYQLGLPPTPMAHTPHLIIVDKWGEIRGRFSWQSPEEMKELRELLETTLAETEPPPKEQPAPSAPQDDDEVEADEEQVKENE